MILSCNRFTCLTNLTFEDVVEHANPLSVNVSMKSLCPMDQCWDVILCHVLFTFDKILNQVKVKITLHIAAMLKLFVFIAAEDEGIHGSRKKLIWQEQLTFDLITSNSFD